MTVRKEKYLTRAMVLAACLYLAGCTPDGGLSPRVLEGTWELTKINGQPVDPGDTFNWEFEEGGDFKIISGSDTYLGEWEWNQAKDELDIEFRDSWGDLYVTEFEIDVLDKETLEGDWLYDGDIYALEFERDL